MSSKQQVYDGIASTYEATLTIPCGYVLFSLIDMAVSTAIAQNPSTRVLELACGTGFYLRRVRSHHRCSYLAGVDISGDMINEASRIDARTRGEQQPIDFRIGDCSEPQLDLGIERGSFDLVMANFLFNYAKSEDEMQGMWQTVASYLKPGGTFLGLSQSFDPSPPMVTDPSGIAKYGMKVTIAEQTDVYVKQILDFQTEPKVVFESYVILDQKVWERTATAAGLTDLQFIYPKEDNIPKGDSKTFWEQYLEHPFNSLMVAHKSQ